MFRCFTLAVLALLFAMAPELTAGENVGKYWLFVGTYTGGKAGSKGIYRMEFDAATGKLSKPVVAAEVDSPSFLAIHPTAKFLYCVNEASDDAGKRGGAVTAYALDTASGTLKYLNHSSSVGSGPCHLNVDKT